MLNDAIEYINALGFPIFACLMLGIFLYKRDREDREDRLLAREENAKERREFLKTNQKLSDNLKFFQVDVKNDIHDLKTEQEKNSTKLDKTDEKIDEIIKKMDYIDHERNDR